MPEGDASEGPTVERIAIGRRDPGRSRGGPFVTISGRLTGGSAKGVYVIVDGHPFPTFYGKTTGGVADRMGLPACERAGFERSLPLSEVGSGSHRLSVAIVADDGQSYRITDRRIDDFRMVSEEG